MIHSCYGELCDQTHCAASHHHQVSWSRRILPHSPDMKTQMNPDRLTELWQDAGKQASCQTVSKEQMLFGLRSHCDEEVSLWSMHPYCHLPQLPNRSSCGTVDQLGVSPGNGRNQPVRKPQHINTEPIVTLGCKAIDHRQHIHNRLASGGHYQRQPGLIWARCGSGYMYEWT